MIGERLSAFFFHGYVDIVHEPRYRDGDAAHFGGMPIKLHYAEVLNPRKVCALAKHLDAPVTYVHVDLAKGGHKTPAYRAMNPNGRVPVLEDGEKTLWESDAILCHLARRTGSDMFPRDDDRQIDVIRWLSWNQVHFQPLGGTFYFENVIKAMFGIGPPNPAKLKASTEPFRTFAKVLDDHLADRAWLVGDAPTVADFSVAGALPFAGQAQLPIAEFAAIRRWHDRLNGFDAWRDPYPAQAQPA